MIKTDFTINKKTILIMLISGIILLALSFMGNFAKANEKDITREEKYCRYLEEKLIKTLEGAIGKGNVSAMITLEIPKQTEEKDSFTPVISVHNEDVNQNENDGYQISGVMIVCKNLTSQEDFAVIKKAAATALGIQEKQIYIIGGEASNEKNP